MFLFVTAVGGGLTAAFLSQATSADYHAVVRTTAILVAVSAGASGGFAAAIRGPVRWLPALFTALGAVGGVEAAIRVWWCG